MTHVLSAQNLQKSFKGRQVVKSASFEIRSGEVVGLFGPNGAGKTTCFYMVLGLCRADAGEIRLDGEVLTHQPVYVRARKGIGYLPQEASIFRKLSVSDNILAILQTRPDLNAAECDTLLEKLLYDFHLQHVRHSLGISLSGGERRRAEIARLMARSPHFILLDEPFAGVDPISIADIRALVQQVSAAGVGVLITDHNVRDTLSSCHKAYIVNNGEVIASGPPAAILNNPQVREVYLGETFQI